jgi:alpha-1,3-rhamnosyltransferase
MTDNKDLVSIIVVSYNHSAFLIECLDSVLAQSYKNWELIVADDASKDSSQSVIEDWLLKNDMANVQKVFHTKNVGLCRTLNECLALVKGQYIKLIAADDVMLPVLLQQSINKLTSLDNDYGLVYSNAMIIDEHSIQVESKTLLDPNIEAPSGWVREKLTNGNFVPALSVMMRTEVYDKIGKYAEDIVTEDYDTWLRTSQFFKFAYINEVLSCYRVHSANISAQLDFSSDVIRTLIKNDIDGEFSEKIKKLVMDRYYLKTMKPEIFESYKQFKFNKKWLVFCIENKLPYRLFRILDKLGSALKG